MRRLLGTVIGCGSVLLVSGLVVSDARAQFNPASGCDVHAPRLQGRSYRDLCDIGELATLAPPVAVPIPSIDYPGVPACDGSQPPRWPVCATAGAEPDRGYRYPLVRSGSHAQVEQRPGPRVDGAPVDEWPVCVSDTDPVTAVSSNPGVQTCGGATPIEVGRCRASAHYYEKLSTLAGSNPGERFYNFLPNLTRCTPCAHDVLSGIETCKEICRGYFRKLAFIYNKNDANDPGRWVIDLNDSGTTLDDGYANNVQVADPVSAGGDGIAYQTLRTEVINGSSYDGMTPLEACIKNCGPVDLEVPAHSDGAPCHPGDPCVDPPDDPCCAPVATRCDPDLTTCCNPSVTTCAAGTRCCEPAPPWVTEFSNQPPVEKNNHWHYVRYARWDPNDRQDGWFRSYTVNPDKPTAPKHVCEELVGQYCNDTIPLSQGIMGSTLKRTECKKDIPTNLPAGLGWPFPPGGGHLTFGNGGDEPNDPQFPQPFCTYLHRGNYLCPKSCYFHGNDAADNQDHLCAGQNTLLCTPPNPACLPGDVCHQAKAVCCCQSGTGCVGAPACADLDVVRIAPILHVDASSSANLTLSGSDVDGATDLTGNGNHLQLSAALTGKPTFAVGGIRAGLGSIRFNNGKALQSVNQTPFDGPSFTAFVVFRANSFDIWNFVIGDDTYQWSTGWGLEANNAQLGAYMNGGPAQRVAVAASTTYVAAVVYDGATIVSYLNGTLQTTDTSVAGYNPVPFRLSLGNSDYIVTAWGLDGWVGEVLFYPGVVSSSDRGTITSYLTTKWN